MVSSRSSSYSTAGTNPIAVESFWRSLRMIASLASMASRWNCVPAGSPRGSPGAGRMTWISGKPCG
ncbi:Uncharacterised protein [Mycobacteroides abscessus subsp. abscessus]|nr:Uncharacterised protein [Mycobacteroides abscessus subsp. abscessus]